MLILSASAFFDLMAPDYLYFDKYGQNSAFQRSITAVNRYTHYFITVAEGLLRRRPTPVFVRAAAGRGVHRLRHDPRLHVLDPLRLWRGVLLECSELYRFSHFGIYLGLVAVGGG
jgi:hypothetical protein